MQEIIERIIDDFHQKKTPELLKREKQMACLAGRVSVVVGMRRSGKTFFCYQTMNSLLSEGLDIHRILYINFEDERLLPFNHENFQDILDAYYRKYPSFKDLHCHLFLDEVQRIEGWDMFVRRVLDTENISVYVTGSSSRLLSSEIASSLRGRALTTEIFPLSFREFINFHRINTEAAGSFSSKSRAELQHSLNQYITTGGFPEVQNLDDDLRRQVLRDYIDVVLLRDVIERHGVRNTVALRSLMRHTLQSPSTRFSVNKFYNNLRSQGITCTKNDLYEFNDFLCDAFLLYQAHLQARSERARSINPRKIYIIDTGLISAFSLKAAQDRGALLENIVYMELRRKGIKPSYYITKNSREVDFFIPDDFECDTRLLQVCWSLDDKETKNREMRALLEAMDEQRINEGLIITWLDEDSSDKRIRIVPLWKWLIRS